MQLFKELFNRDLSPEQISSGINHFLKDKTFEEKNKKYVLEAVIGYSHGGNTVTLTNHKLASFTDVACLGFESHFWCEEIKNVSEYSKQLGSVLNIGLEFKGVAAKLQYDAANWEQGTQQENIVVFNRIFKQKWYATGDCTFYQPATDLGENCSFIRSCTLVVGYQVFIELQNSSDSKQKDQTRYSVQATLGSLGCTLGYNTGGELSQDKYTHYKAWIKPVGHFVPPVLNAGMMSLVEYVQKLDQSFCAQLDSERTHCILFIDEHQDVFPYPVVTVDQPSLSEEKIAKIKIKNAEKISDTDLFDVVGEIIENNKEFLKNHLQVKDNYTNKYKPINLKILAQNFQAMLHNISFTTDIPFIFSGQTGSGKSTFISYAMQIPLQGRVARRKGGGKERLATVTKYKCFLTDKQPDDLIRGIYFYRKDEQVFVTVVHASFKVAGDQKHTKLISNVAYNNQELLTDTMLLQDITQKLWYVLQQLNAKDDTAENDDAEKKLQVIKNISLEIEKIKLPIEPNFQQEVFLSDELIEFILQYCRNYPKIGSNDGASETNFPTLHMLSGGYFAYDSAGISDNRGPEFNIVNQWGLECIAQHNNGNFGPIVVFIDSTEFFRNKQQGLINLSNLLSSLFINPEEMVTKNSLFIVLSNKSEDDAQLIKDDAYEALLQVYAPLHKQYGHLIKEKLDNVANPTRYQPYINFLKKGLSLVKTGLDKALVWGNAATEGAGPSEQELQLLFISGMLLENFNNMVIVPDVFENEGRLALLQKLSQATPCQANEVCFGQINDASVHIKDLMYLFIDYANNLIEKRQAKALELQQLQGVVKTASNQAQALTKLSDQISDVNKKIEANTKTKSSIEKNDKLVYYKKWKPHVERGFWQWGNSDANAVKCSIDILSEKSKIIENPYNGTLEGSRKGKVYEGKFWGKWCWKSGSPNVTFHVPYSLLDTSKKKCVELDLQNDQLKKWKSALESLKLQMEKVSFGGESMQILKESGEAELSRIRNELNNIDEQISKYSPLFSLLHNLLVYKNSLFFTETFKSEMCEEELDSFKKFIVTMERLKGVSQSPTLTSMTTTVETTTNPTPF